MKKRYFGVEDRDHQIQMATSRKAAQANAAQSGGVLVTRRGTGVWKPVKGHRVRRTFGAVIIIGGVITVIAVAASGTGSTGSQGTGSASATSSAGPDTVCFDVTGTGNPTISYGSDSDNRDAGGQIGTGNQLPWHACMPANRDALYWDVTAQLQGGGNITATVTEVRPDGTSKTLKTAHASGGYQIANAEYVGYVG